MLIVVVSAPDQSSHSIYVFGGWGSTHDESDGAVYVLSLPSFTWIRVNQDSTLRSRHHCSLVGKSTMLVVGGITPMDDFSLPIWTTQGCDNGTLFNQGLATFDLSNHSWSTNYDPLISAQAYQVHPSIFNVIGGNTNGGAKIQAPIGGFDQQALGTVLSAGNVTNNTTNSTGSANAKSKPAHEVELSPAAMAGIIGASITGFVLIAAVGFAIYLKRRRKLWAHGAAELNAHNVHPEPRGQKKLSELDNGMRTPVELGNEKDRDKDRQIFVGHAELGDVKEWVFELSAASVTNKSLPPTPIYEKSEFI